jgi:hypothetical protein
MDDETGTMWPRVVCLEFEGNRRSFALIAALLGVPIFFLKPSMIHYMHF